MPLPPWLGAVPLVGVAPGEGLGSVLLCKYLQSVLWLQGCCENLQPLSRAGDRRILWVFHENSSQVPWRQGAGEPELDTAACSAPRDLGALFAPSGLGALEEAWGTTSWYKQQCWNRERGNTRAGGQIQGLMPHMLPFSLVTVPVGWWWCSAALL